jgi:hypothetical protein
LLVDSSLRLGLHYRNQSAAGVLMDEVDYVPTTQHA